MILAIGFRVRSIRGVQFRQWANRNLAEYLRKGFVIDDERLKNPDGRPDYFDELLDRIRDIRASEKRFYQKVRDLFALSSDYDPTDKATQMFYAETQNKLLYAITGHTSAEIVMQRADADAPNMGLYLLEGCRSPQAGRYYRQKLPDARRTRLFESAGCDLLETAEFRSQKPERSYGGILEGRMSTKYWYPTISPFYPMPVPLARSKRRFRLPGL